MSNVAHAASPAELPRADWPPHWSAAASDWRTQAVIVFALQIAHHLFESVRTDPVLLFAGLLDWLSYKADEGLRQSVNVATAVVALQFIDRLPSPHPHRRPLAWAAMALAALVSAALASTMLPYEPVAVRVGASASTAVWFWYTLWMNSLIGALALVAVDRLRGRQQAMLQLARAQAQGRLMRERLVASQLLTIQARVDPQLLFDMLAAVKRFYAQDVPRAERLLDDLAAFLRAALPRLRSARSTLEQEFALVQAYVRLLRGAGAAPIELQLDMPDELARLAFPAGVLLPLLSGASAAPRCIGLTAAAHGPVLRVQLSDTTTPAAGTRQRLCDSLLALYGERSALTVQPQGANTVTTLEVPLEPA